jgi:hypothetical protein
VPGADPQAPQGTLALASWNAYAVNLISAGSPDCRRPGHVAGQDRDPVSATRWRPHRGMVQVTGSDGRSGNEIFTITAVK